MESEATTYIDLGLTVAQYLLPVLLALVGWATTKLAKWLDAKTKQQLVMGILARISEGAYTIVRSVEQRVVARIKKGREPDSPGGTNLTDAEAAEVAAEGLAALKDWWGMPGLALLKKILGLDDVGADALLSHHIEAAVHDMPPKAAAALVDPTRASTPD